MSRALRLLVCGMALSSQLGLLVCPTAFGQRLYGLQYDFSYTTPAYPGGSTVLINTFTNTADVQELVAGFFITSDLWNLSVTNGLPFLILAGHTTKLNATEQIPSNASVSIHTLTLHIYYQYDSPSTFGWVSPGSSPLTEQKSIVITSAPLGLAGLGLLIVGTIIVLAVVAVAWKVLLSSRRRVLLERSLANSFDTSGSRIGDPVIGKSQNAPKTE